jgi:hypothetical protein
VNTIFAAIMFVAIEAHAVVVALFGWEDPWLETFRKCNGRRNRGSV